jgi:hypothetical protein
MSSDPGVLAVPWPDVAVVVADLPGPSRTALAGL